jgi:predicted enzyme related to lactoylglutathione lyase
MTIEVIATQKHSSDEDKLWGLALKTDDIDATHARLKQAGVNVSDIRDGRKAGTRVCTVKSHCMDVPTLIIGLVD